MLTCQLIVIYDKTNFIGVYSLICKLSVNIPQCMDMEHMFINVSNMHYTTSNEWIGKLVEEVVVAYFKELSNIVWAE
jgi:hypothetical protein